MSAETSTHLPPSAPLPKPSHCFLDYSGVGGRPSEQRCTGDAVSLKPLLQPPPPRSILRGLPAHGKLLSEWTLAAPAASARTSSLPASPGPGPGSRRRDSSRGFLEDGSIASRPVGAHVLGAQDPFLGLFFQSSILTAACLISILFPRAQDHWTMWCSHDLGPAPEPVPACPCPSHCPLPAGVRLPSGLSAWSGWGRGASVPPVLA